MAKRPRQAITFVGFVIAFVLVFSLLTRDSELRPPASLTHSLPSLYTSKSEHNVADEPPPALPQPSQEKPRPAPGGSHPMWHLIGNAENELEATKARQSTTLEEAVTEYRRRYGIPPPPKFDKWWEFAKERGLVLVDEFDGLHEMLTPFWGVKPETIRRRAAEAMGQPNMLMGLQVRRSNVTNLVGASDWQREATVGMMSSFIGHLPDMDLIFNVHDEPRVMVPHAELSRLVRTAKRVNMPAAEAVVTPRNHFSSRPPEMNDGTRFHEFPKTRFNQFAHQPTWTHSRLSCPPDTPAQALDEIDRVDAVRQYSVGDLGFVDNVTAMSDICLTPSLAETHGFFDRPNAFNIVHELFPIFSQSKLSSFNDLIYPSPWYWYDKAPYEENKDMDWETKQDKLYWRGSTTGGYSRDGGWRRQHRQIFVTKINDKGQAKILFNRDGDSLQGWQVKQVARTDFEDLMDVYFSHIGQCDAQDCDAQREFFKIQKQDERSDAFKSKYVLDIDGNAFSGRFYAFLKSKSLVFKWGIFREWHVDWLWPWAHYIPMSLKGDEWLEAVRFFGDGTLGKKEAERMAMQSRQWANQVLRKEDMEVWFFRLLLEYGRLVDDGREEIGYA